MVISPTPIKMAQSMKNDWYADPIIRVLPQAFFMDCAILIGVGLIAMAVGILVWESRKKKT